MARSHEYWEERVVMKHGVPIRLRRVKCYATGEQYLNDRSQWCQHRNASQHYWMAVVRERPGLVKPFTGLRAATALRSAETYVLRRMRGERG